MVRPLDCAYLTGLLAASPYLLARALRTGRYRQGLLARARGAVAVSPPQPRVPRAWFHGVSVGEVHLLRQVVAGFRKRHPQWECVVSSSTDTGLAEARRCFPDSPVIAWPLDFSWAVRRALAAVGPRVLVLAEGELWPNMLRAAKLQRIPVAVINGRFSPRSARRYQTFGRWLRPMLHQVDLFAMQTEEYADTLRALGVQSTRVTVTGSVKYDGLPNDPDHPRTQELQRLFGLASGEMVWVAGSTQTPEERHVLAIYQRLRRSMPRLRLILVPRQRDRFDEVARLLEGQRVPYVRRSQLGSAGLPRPQSAEAPVILVDTIGELGAIWGLADLAFVGGSLDGQRGGQNMLEPAAVGAAVTFGPHVWNFREPAGRLVREGGAIQVADAAELESVSTQLLGDPARRKRLGATARRLVLSQQGATQKTLDALDLLAAPTLARVG